MKFAINIRNGQGCRIGMLSGLQSNPEMCYETPFSLITTKGGSIPHLTKDIFHNSFSKNLPICVPAQHFTHHQDVLQEFKRGISYFSSLPTHPVCVTIQDPTQATPNGFNNGSSVSVWTSAGRHKICSKKFTNLIEVMNPDWYETLNDADTDSQSTSKRIEKSVKNSLKFLNECLELRQDKKSLQNVGIFCPLIGGCSVTDRAKWSEAISQMEVDGFIVSGLHQNGSAAENLQLNNLRELVNASVENLPTEKPRQALGAFNVLNVIELIECGIDIFDSSLPYLASERGAALCFPNSFAGPFISKSTQVFPLDSCITPDDNTSTLKERESPENKSVADPEASYIKKKRLGGNKVVAISESPVMESEDHVHLIKEASYEINLKNKKYFGSQEPVVEGCSCYTCTNFTKSYVHHLLTVREMLAEILLMIHNLHHWDVFFATIKEAIKKERWEEFKQIVSTDNIKENVN